MYFEAELLQGSIPNPERSEGPYSNHALQDDQRLHPLQKGFTLRDDERTTATRLSAVRAG